jgi:hypothetical protein
LLGQAGAWQKESSFGEQATTKGPRRKEAKKLSPFGAGSVDHSPSSRKSFFASFFSKKEDSCLQPNEAR